MSNEYWGICAVDDHCADGAFVADLMLYDRLVVAFPSDDTEAARWESNGWYPNRLERLLAGIGDDRLKRVPWRLESRERWGTAYSAARQRETPATTFGLTTTQLTNGFWPHVPGVEVLTTYKSLNVLSDDLGIRRASENVQIPSRAISVIVSHQFLVPHDSRRTEQEVLCMARELSSDEDVRRKRANLWRWQFDFVAARTWLTPASTPGTAVEEMRELVAEQHEVIRRAKIPTRPRYAFLFGTAVGSSAAEMESRTAPGMAASTSHTFVSVGQFAAERLERGADTASSRPIAVLLSDTHQHFSWV